MALLEKRDRVEVKRVALRMPVDALELLDKYAQYLNRDEADVLAAAIKYAVQLDKEFCREAGISQASGQRGRGTTEPSA